MAQAVLAGRAKESFDYVYGQERLDLLKSLTALDEEVVTQENFFDRDLGETRYIFSTWGMFPFTDGMFARMPRLEAVFYAAGATDKFAGAFLERGVKVVSAWRANAVPVAEFVSAQIVLALKGYFRSARGMTDPGAWRRPRTAPGVFGETVALIGSGSISTLVKKILANYTLDVITVESLPEKRTLSIEEAFRRGFVVSNHLFNSENNQKCLRKEHFLSMRQGAVFINTGRGQQVDEAGFIEAMRERPDLTALLDVTWPEPPPAGSPLYTLPNVFLTPHIAGSMNDEVRRMADCVIGDFRRFLAGEPLENEVSREMLAVQPAANK
ncbi:MAG: hydroxyacid dehydrogenase [Lentisphaeria bacterium]|nr:hydroxyacid dehydrogenase [Lentisphaeria bacterium]